MGQLIMGFAQWTIKEVLCGRMLLMVSSIDTYIVYNFAMIVSGYRWLILLALSKCHDLNAHKQYHELRR